MRCQHIPQSHGDKDIQQFTPCKMFAAYPHNEPVMDENIRAQVIENRAANILPPVCQIGLWIKVSMPPKSGKNRTRTGTLPKKMTAAYIYI